MLWNIVLIFCSVKPVLVSTSVLEQVPYLHAVISDIFLSNGSLEKQPLNTVKFFQHIKESSSLYKKSFELAVDTERLICKEEAELALEFFDEAGESEDAVWLNMEQVYHEADGKLESFIENSREELIPSDAPGKGPDSFGNCLGGTNGDSVMGEERPQTYSDSDTANLKKDLYSLGTENTKLYREGTSLHIEINSEKISKTIDIKFSAKYKAQMRMENQLINQISPRPMAIFGVVLLIFQCFK
jgi:hypothetical protein